MPLPAGTLGPLFALTALIAAPGIAAIGVLAAMSDWRPGAVALAILFVTACAALARLSRPTTCWAMPM